MLFLLGTAAVAQSGQENAKQVLRDAGASLGFDDSDLTVPLAARPVIFVRAMGNMEDNEIALVAAFRKLDHLFVQSPKITDAGVAGLQKLPQLRFVALECPKVSDQSLKHLATLPRLERLDLSGTGITDAGMKDIVGMPKVKELALRDTALTDAGLITLAGAQKLEKLDIARTKVTDAGVKAFQEARPECKVER